MSCFLLQQVTEFSSGIEVRFRRDDIPNTLSGLRRRPSLRARGFLAGLIRCLFVGFQFFHISSIEGLIFFAIRVLSAAFVGDF